MADELRFVDLSEYVFETARSVAEAQQQLDLAAAETARRLAETEVEIPRLTRTVNVDGTVTETVEYINTNMLSLGMTPKMYQFSETVIEASMDIQVVEEEEETRKLKAGFFDLRYERKLNRDVSAHVRMKTTLVPVPNPLGLADLVDIAPSDQ